MLSTPQRRTCIPSGAVVVDRQLEVIDSSIEEYRNALNGKKLLLADTAADPAYSNLVKALVASAEAEANMGYTDLARKKREQMGNR